MREQQFSVKLRIADERDDNISHLSLFLLKQYMFNQVLL